MEVLSGYNDFLTFRRQIFDKSPQDVRAYWTPERKKAAIPAHRVPSGTMGISALEELDASLPDGANAAPTTDPKQADMSQMPFIAGGKLFSPLTA